MLRKRFAKLLARERNPARYGAESWRSVGSGKLAILLTGFSMNKKSDGFLQLFARAIERAALAVAIYFGSAAQSLAETTTPGWTIPRTSFSAIVWFVQEQGWRARLEPVCEKFGVAHLTPNCLFKQISVEDAAGKSFPRGFNVPLASTGEIPYALLFHLHPLVGEFFIVSPRAQLIAVFVRSKGTDYARIPNELGQRAFETELEFWTTNLEKLRALPKRERLDSR